MCRGLLFVNGFILRILFVHNLFQLNAFDLMGFCWRSQLMCVLMSINIVRIHKLTQFVCVNKFLNEVNKKLKWNFKSIVNDENFEINCRDQATSFWIAQVCFQIEVLISIWKCCRNLCHWVWVHVLSKALKIYYNSKM